MSPKPSGYLILGAPGSGRREVLADLSRSYGLELVLRGHVVLCIDLLTDGMAVLAGPVWLDREDAVVDVEVT